MFVFFSIPFPCHLHFSEFLMKYKCIKADFGYFLDSIQTGNPILLSHICHRSSKYTADSTNDKNMFISGKLPHINISKAASTVGSYFLYLDLGISEQYKKKRRECDRKKRPNFT